MSGIYRTVLVAQVAEYQYSFPAAQERPDERMAKSKSKSILGIQHQMMILLSTGRTY